MGYVELMNTCIYEIEKMQPSAIGLLGLVSMGGSSKSTIAKEIYNYFFEHKKFQFMSFLEIDSSYPPLNMPFIKEKFQRSLKF